MKNKFSNKIAVKLTMYFAAVLLTFSLIMGGLFYQYFKQHNVDVTKKEMNLRATKIAEVISKDLDWLQGRYGDRISQSRFVNSLDNAMQEIVWVVDSEYNLNMNMDVVRKFQARSGKHHERLQRFIPKDSKDAYRKLPQNIKEQVELAFEGHSFILEDYNPFLEDTMLTVGAPVYDKNGVVKAVVMLHSPVQGTKDAIWAGLRILFYSMLAALVLVSVLSIVLSWRFTKPLNLMKEIAMRLADKDYKARCNISQNDEIGELANTLDVLSERLQLADEESQKLEKLRREFIANISHELRTPVTVIRGSLEALRDGVITEPEEVDEYHDQMLSESVFLQRLINDLLDLSRLQNMDFPIEKEPLNLCDVVQDAVRSSRRLGLEKNIEIDLTSDTDIYVLNGDYGRLRQMLLIFLHNSIKFSDEGGKIEVALAKDKLVIKDYGCGIKAEDIPHAFDRFYKARNEKNKSGSGLGLAIAKQIALRHDMTLDLASEQGSYTQITVILPPKEKVE